jgi:phosphoribosyl-AMP cyclohydrolase
MCRVKSRQVHPRRRHQRRQRAMKSKGSSPMRKVTELMIDDDQDCVWLKVAVAGGASCHVGYRTRFYRRIPLGKNSKALEFTETAKVFDPQVVYGDAPNPTKL